VSQKIERIVLVGVVILLAVFLIAQSRTACAGMFPSTYDRSIQGAVAKYWPGMSWYWLRAQLWQESHLDPDARSGVGAQGLAQFMPGTWADISRQLGYGTYPRTAIEPAIDGAAYYMAQLKRSWPLAADLDRHYFGLGSYNAGLGNIFKAAKACDNRILWDAVAPCLAGVTGAANAAQTTDYVVKIKRWFALMETGT
jgi:hypothetical protein